MRRSLMNIFGLLLLLDGTLAAGWEFLGREPVAASIAEQPVPRLTATPGGTRKRIEGIQIGDRVLARDEFSEEIGWHEVDRVYRRVSDHLRILKVRSDDGVTQTLETTDEHPFWSADRQAWVNAGELRLGEHLTTSDGDPQTVVFTTYEHRPEGVPVYNFRVVDAHTYYVTAPEAPRGPPVLVHNANYPNTRKDIGLGLRLNRQGDGLLEPWAHSVGALTQKGWAGAGLADANVPFVRRFYQAAYRSSSRGGRIKFNLDDLDLGRALKTRRFSDPFESAVSQIGNFSKSSIIVNIIRQLTFI
ncbi:polymorphic toxin-type HINT domain-containing protein [Calycomorphotria hydatis]|uniref:Intein C-terminal splicing domain-containing protein n=1 Tax=Calycomorphotria hydatis TaxID=2528027 RepID=A0A517T8L1_9PLAN|nr:polymorphic toxin-type HINT domain-containing protein [Calycomorphotria hydatis]QDT64703.1 hypothetical protein V22_19440 [Calycomorphotria hydatis]